MKANKPEREKKAAPSQKGAAGKNGWVKTWSVLKKTGRYTYQFRGVIISIPVLVAAIVIACQNMARLPDSVGINLLSTGDYSFMLPKLIAVLIPVVVTGFSVLLTVCSKRVLYPWIVSLFTLVLPILIWITNIYPV